MNLKDFIPKSETLVHSQIRTLNHKEHQEGLTIDEMNFRELLKKERAKMFAGQENRGC